MEPAIINRASLVHLTTNLLPAVASRGMVGVLPGQDVGWRGLKEGVVTDNINALFVAMEEDIREDDIEKTINAIGHIKGVLRVEKNIVNSMDAWTEHERLRIDYFTKMTNIFFPVKKE